MTDTTALKELIEQLHQANREVSEAARPLDHLSEMDFEQRKQLGAQIRAALERWDCVTKQIGQTIGLE